MTEPQGFIDRIADNSVQGWAWNPDDPDRAVFVEVTSPSGEKVVTRANLFRKDLMALGNGKGCHAFHVSFVGPPPADGLNGGVSVVIAGSNERLAMAGHAPELPEQALGDDAGPPRMTPDVQAEYHNLRIASIKRNVITVRIDGDPEGCLPTLMIGKRQALLQPCRDPLDQTRQFLFEGWEKGDAIRLYGLTGAGAELFEERLTASPSLDRAIMSQLSRAARIARQPGAVAIACWEGGHNPVGRAKVLYDVLKGRRPVVMFCYLFEAFGNDIWPPLDMSREDIVLIPWDQRELYHEVMHDLGIAFETVWICKPRAPSFHMAAALAAPDARLVLDIDDNEDSFARGEKAPDHPFGFSSLAQSHALIHRVPARTAASVSLVSAYDAHLLRHVRNPVADQPQGSRNSVSRLAGRKTPIRLGFVGTVRPHKRLVEAALAIRALNDKGANLEFHVRGDFAPPSLRDELASHGVVVGPPVPMSHLSEVIAAFDIVLTGFPGDDTGSDDITRFQVSSKIGDGLACGKPVLTPDGPSVADLQDVKGVFLFTSDSFATQLKRAIKATRSSSITLPDDFSPEAAFKVFEAAEAQAGAEPRARDVLDVLPYSNAQNLPKTVADVPVLLVLWKQFDAGLYGRRVDQLCRAYKAVYPDHRVVVADPLSTLDELRISWATSGLADFEDLHQLNRAKQDEGYVSDDGIEYRQFKLTDDEDFYPMFLRFLAGQGIGAHNTIAVLFPILPRMDAILKALAPYRKIVDVVDNHLAWTSPEDKPAAMHKYLAMGQGADAVLFNSQTNRDFFCDHGLIETDRKDVTLLQNWYQLPAGVKPTPAHNVVDRRPEDDFHVFYSGNMSDRMDWALFLKISDLDPRVKLGLIGRSNVQPDALSELQGRSNVRWYGPRTENDTLALLAQAHLAILPHKVDDVSAFMNPIKVHMYRALGLPTLATDVPGIVADDLLTIATSHDTFLASLRAFMDAPGPARGQPANDPSNCGRAYVELIERLRNPALASE